MKKVLMTIIALMVVLLIAVFLNVPILRGIISFVYLSFIPGFLILRILKLGKTSLADTLLFSVGLSLVFLMLVGLLINEFYLVGVSQPLSTFPLALGVSLSTLLLLFVCYRRNLLDDFSSFRVNLKVTNVLLFRCAILILLPVLGVVGALFLNIPILLLLIVWIAVLFALSILSSKLFPSEFYPLLIFSVSLAFLFSAVFSSKYIIGYDANLEYYVFRLTQINGHWSFLDPTLYTTVTVNFNSMLSITILPSIYQSLMNISGETLFKLLYPFIFSLVPVVLYRLFEKQVGRLASLASIFLFISGDLVFYGVTAISLDRQIVGMLFFTLSIFVLLKEDMAISRRRLLLVVFAVALLVSHYSLMYVYLVFISFIYVVSKIRGDFDKVLNGRMILFFFVATFSWYGLSVSPLATFAQFLSGFISNFSTDILNPAARTTQSLVTQSGWSITNVTSTSVFYATQILIAIGILCVIFVPKRAGLSAKYRATVFFGAVLLASCFALPNLAPSLNLDRFYEISLLLLVPCFYLGFKICGNLCKSVWTKAIGKLPSQKRFVQVGLSLLCILLISFLLLQSGFVNHFTGDSPLLRSVNIDRLEASNNFDTQVSFDGAYISEQNAFSAIWLSRNMGNSTIYADYDSANGVLTSCGLINQQQISSLSTTPALQQAQGGFFIYLSQLNIMKGIMTAYGITTFNTSDTLFLSQSNIIYSNGNSEVLYVPPRVIG